MVPKQPTNQPTDRRARHNQPTNKLRRVSSCEKQSCSLLSHYKAVLLRVQVEAMTAPGLVCQSAPFEKGEFDWILPRSQPSHIRHALTWDHDDCVACVVDKSFDLPAHVMDLLDRAVACKALPKTSFVIDEADCALDEISLFKQYDGALFTHIATLRLVCFSPTFDVHLSYVMFVCGLCVQSLCLIPPCLPGLVTSFFKQRCEWFLLPGP